MFPKFSRVLEGFIYRVFEGFLRFWRVLEGSMFFSYGVLDDFL